MRTGFTQTQKDYVAKSKDILKNAGIGTSVGGAWNTDFERVNLIWAPNRGPYNHTDDYAKAVWNGLKSVPKEQIPAKLRQLGIRFAEGQTFAGGV